jgi:hypothetical protein
MTLKRLSLLLLVSSTSLAWGADSKENLNQARVNYQQAVAQHGANSPEAKSARSNLRNARRNFHAERRQRAKNHTSQ